MLIIVNKTLPRLYYDSKSRTLTMTLPGIDHEAVIGLWRKAMESYHKYFAPPKQLQKALNMGQCTTSWVTEAIVDDSDNMRTPDLLFGTNIGEYATVELGPLEVGGSQPLHGKQGVLATVSDHLLSHDLRS